MDNTLIARLEAATEDSRELDAEIHIAASLCDPSARYEPNNDVIVWLEHHPEVPGGASQVLCDELPHYTESIDSAITLIPAGWHWQVENEATSDGKARAWLHERAKTGRGRSKNAFADTPALALCIAALRAMDNDKDGKAG